MRHFRTTTKGKPVIMGRKTWASLTGPLADRDNIVLTRDTAFRADGVWSFAALDVALACARTQAIARGVDEVCVIGGAQVYAEALPFADRIHLTDIDAVVEGDAWFPELDRAVWREVAGRAAQAGPEDDHAMRFRVLERVT